MTKKEILRKAVDKAIENGYTGHLKYYPTFIDQIATDCREGFLTDEFYDNYMAIVFSHSFAKEFFKNVYGMGGKTDFKCHLQEMVIEENPINYLKKFL